MRDFYLTTNSIASIDTFPDNTLVNFTTKLSSTITLSGDWVCGLSAISVPRSFLNITKYDCLMTFKERNEAFHLHLPAGFYETAKKLIEQIDHIFDRAGLARKVIFHHDRFSNKTSISLRKHCSLVLCKNLAEILGFAQTEFNAYVKLSGIYIYCSILDYIYLGDSSSPLLDVVALKSHSSAPQYVRYNLVHYKKIRNLQFSTINFRLTNDVGENVYFQNGKVLLTLHFKQVVDSATS